MDLIENYVRQVIKLFMSLLINKFKFTKEPDIRTKVFLMHNIISLTV